jgi:hypothetical protein
LHVSITCQDNGKKCVSFEKEQDFGVSGMYIVFVKINKIDIR